MNHELSALSDEHLDAAQEMARKLYCDEPNPVEKKALWAEFKAIFNERERRGMIAAPTPPPPVEYSSLNPTFQPPKRIARNGT